MNNLDCFCVFAWCCLYRIVLHHGKDLLSQFCCLKVEDCLLGDIVLPVLSDPLWCRCPWNWESHMSPSYLVPFCSLPSQHFPVIGSVCRCHLVKSTFWWIPNTTQQQFYGPFSGTTRWAGAKRELLWTLWCKGRLTEADTLTIRLAATPSRLTSAHLHHPPSNVPSPMVHFDEYTSRNW